MATSGRFITVEGIEGSGKSTFLSNLAARLREAGHHVIATREPGGTPFGDALRELFVTPTLTLLPMTEAFAVNASRAQHVGDVIAPALRDGSIVLCDRFGDAALAYQGYGRGLDLGTLRELGRIASGGIEPERTFLLDIDVGRSRARVLERAVQSGVGVDRLEREDRAFHDRVRAGYLELARAEPARFRVLDARATPEELVAAAMRDLGLRRTPDDA